MPKPKNKTICTISISFITQVTQSSDYRRLTLSKANACLRNRTQTVAHQAFGILGGRNGAKLRMSPMTKVSKAGQRERKETQRNGKSIKIALKGAWAGLIKRRRGDCLKRNLWIFH
jgi:hypothetical protein